MWFHGRASELEQSAKQAWAGLVDGANLPISGWSLSRLSMRDNANASQIIYIAEHRDCGRFTYKFQLRPQAPDRFALHYEMQVRAFDVFPHSEHLTLPKPVFLDAQNQVSLITYLEGYPLSESMRGADLDRSKQLKLLEMSGRWLDAYHRTEIEETRIFQPRHTIQYYSKLRGQITSGETKVVAKQLFLKGIEKIIGIAPKYEGQETVSAVQHGDYHMRNLILDGHRIAGIDISKTRPAPVGYDIAKILLDYTAIMRSKEDLGPEAVVPDDALEAFFSGYTLVSKDDPSVGFLLYARILATLIDVPQSKEMRTDAKQRTLTRLRPIAQNAFRSIKPNSHTSL